MKIIHISDFHYKSRSYEKFTEEGIIDELCTSLSNYKKSIDLVIFTGDLVNSGKNIGDFNEAKKFFIDKIAKSLDITNNNIIICPGNHDIDRNSRLESLELFFNNNINSNQALNEFTNEKSKDYENSFQGFINYNNMSILIHN
jgi:3',5'-cyclic AMP phosphodiesterase CpdA